jgi:SAM-dependent methyltransferase
VQRPYWAPPEVDIDRPASSRIYDYVLGGSHNFEADRVVAEKAIAAMPQLPSVLRENRRFLRRAVRYLAGEAGIDQFLDLGSGIPTVGNVHEIAGAINPAVRVVYVDIDPIAVAHAGAILVDDPNAAAIQADFRDVEAVLTDPVVGDVLALDRPVAVLLVAALHFVPDDDITSDILSHLRTRLPRGSYLALSHATSDGRPPTGQSEAQEIYARSDNQITMRTAASLTTLLAGWTPVPPGMVRCPLWRPDDPLDPDASQFPGYSVVAHLP